jgi:hypothetical protein
MVKEDIFCGLSCNILLISYQNDHLRELINNQKNEVVAMLGGW